MNLYLYISCLFILLALTSKLLLLSIYLFIFMSILLVVGYIPKSVLNHLLYFIWEVSLGRRNLISFKHIWIFMFLFTYIYKCCYPFNFKLFPIPFYFNVIPFNFKHFSIPFILLSSQNKPLILKSFAQKLWDFLNVKSSSLKINL